MKRDPLVGMMRGTITSDETYIGGKPKNKHQQGRKRVVAATGRGRGGVADKTPLLSLVDRATGEVRSRVMPEVTGATLHKATAEQVDMPNSVLHTDKMPDYKQIGTHFLEHHVVDHSRHEYVRGMVTTNHAEGYFSQLKRSIDGTHHGVSVKHLDRYLVEFDFRYSTRKLSDTQRMVNWSTAWPTDASPTSR